MFERFTEDARAVVVRARDEARRLGHDAIGTDHLLLGVLGGGELPGARLLAGWGLTRESVLAQPTAGDAASLDADALATLGIDLAEVRRRVEATFGRGALSPRSGCRRPRAGGAIPFTPHAKNALELALREALALGDRHIGDDHVVLGLLREGDGSAARLLAEHGARLDVARDIVAGRSAA